jgi:hypothetical protein
MPMPEAPMHKDYLLYVWKNQVRFPWQFRDIQTASISGRFYDLTDSDFRTSILASNE